MKKERKPQQFLRAPGYPGGRKALGEFLKKNLKYPKQALENGVQGNVLIEMVIDQKGKVTQVEVLKGLGHGCDEEAARIGKLLRFSPKKHRGVRVTFKKKLNIPFRMKKVAGQKLNYQLKKKEEPKSEKKNDKGDSYGYTIKW